MQNIGRSLSNNHHIFLLWTVIAKLTANIAGEREFFLFLLPDPMGSGSIRFGLYMVAAMFVAVSI